MNRRRTTHWMIATTLLVFACAPVLSPSVISTLGPEALNTAIAGTAAAAAAGTNDGSGAEQPAFTPPSGPILDPVSLNTAIAATAAAAGTQTAALIPPTLTPSFTPFPSKTPTITPSPTAIFVFQLPTRTNTPRPPATSTSSGGGDGGGGGGGGGGGKAAYACSFISVSPANGTRFNKRQEFQTVWRVRNTGDAWLRTSVDLTFVGGNKFSAVDGADLTTTVQSGDAVNLPAINMRAPASVGDYSTSWSLRVGHQYFCSLSLRITVR